MRPVFVSAIALASSLGAGCIPRADAGTTRGTIALEVDATDVQKSVLHAKLTLPAHSGRSTFTYPKWIPGEHGPTGPINALVGVRFSFAGKPVPWRRDAEDMYAFQVDVPTGATSIDAELDFLLPGEGERFSAGASSTPKLLDLSWHYVVLYPKGGGSDDWAVAPKLRLPAGWRYGTALTTKNESGGAIDFAPVSLTTLVDSPVIAGVHFKSVPLTTGTAPTHTVDLVADSAAALDFPPSQVDAWKQLVAETDALFGARHYGTYHFLVTLSDHVASFGLEHHESSDNRVGERTLVDDGKRKLEAGLLPHEFVHSWNGKYRRPEGLATADYQTAMKGDLLWVYEGLTTYLGDVLTPRSGLQTAEQFRDELAIDAAVLAHRPGRAWRSLDDTAVAAQLLYQSPREGSSYRRSVDFYREGKLIWLEADVVIRQKTNGQRSLDDFCRRFHGGKSGPAMVRAYSFEDVVAALDEIAPHDWKGFFETRLRSHDDAPLGGLTESGWKLVYDETPSEVAKLYEGEEKLASFLSSLGMVVQESGTVQDAVPGMPAAKAGIAPRMKLIAVNERRYSPELLHEAIKAAKGNGPPIALLAESDEFFHTYTIDYHDGDRYPHLVRDDAKPDLLAEIIKPHAPSVSSTEGAGK